MLRKSVSRFPKIYNWNYLAMPLLGANLKDSKVHMPEILTVFTAAGSVYKSHATETRRMSVENARIHKGILFSYKD